MDMSGTSSFENAEMERYEEQGFMLVGLIVAIFFILLALSVAHLSRLLYWSAGVVRTTELPGGRTRVEGTTWYSHSMWPESYWHWWSDYIIHRIHLRVLEHIRARAEAPAPS